MMRAVWITLVPMLAVAALVLWGGERIARRTTEERIPADRDRLFDFTATMRGELDRLEELYLSHLGEIARQTAWLERKDIAKRCENIVGIRTCDIFGPEGREPSIEGRKPPVGEAAKIPAVMVEGETGRLAPRNAVILPKELLAGEAVASGWLAGPDESHRAHWQRVAPSHVVVFVIDQRELNGCLEAHFAKWMEAPFSPLREAGELVSIEGPGRSVWVKPPAETQAGPAAMALPHRTSLGEWQVLAWDKLKVGNRHDPAVLASAACIAFVLLLTGLVLQGQQRRALHLAEERVSFVNRVSHELGTPLTNILLNLDLAQRAIEERPVESSRRLLLVNEEVQRLGRLVSNVLTFSRRERKLLDLRSAICIPDEVVANVLAQFQPSLERRKVQVEWQRGAGERTRLDPDALAQITGNLISNVEKYASAGGWLGLETTMMNGRLYLRVTDRGPGIPSHQREKVFEAFERVHRTVSEGASGTGLGLAIARDLARRMDGDLVLVPTQTGTRFELDLPAPAALSIISNGHPSVA